MLQFLKMDYEKHKVLFTHLNILPALSLINNEQKTKEVQRLMLQFLTEASRWCALPI